MTSTMSRGITIPWRLLLYITTWTLSEPYVHFSICNVTGEIGLDPMDANDRKILDLLHKKLNPLPKELKEISKASTRGNTFVSERTCGSSRVVTYLAMAVPRKARL